MMDFAKLRDTRFSPERSISDALEESQAAPMNMATLAHVDAEKFAGIVAAEFDGNAFEFFQAIQWAAARSPVFSRMLDRMEAKAERIGR